MNHFANFKSMISRSTLLLLLSLFSMNLLAQGNALLENNELLMGKTVKLTVSVNLPSDTAKVEFPLLEAAIKDKRKFVPLLNDTIELLTSYTTSREKNGNVDVLKYNLQLQAFDSGRYELPPFELLVNGNPVETNRATLSVIPVKVKADDQIDGFQDIVEPFEINPNPEDEQSDSSKLLSWLIPVAVAILALIIFLIIYYKKTGRILLISKPLQPYEIALNKLKKLHAQNLPQKGKVKEYYTRLTDILRGYLHRQFGIKTYEKTTSEILYQIKLDDELSHYEPVLKSILETADFVKFAKVKPSVVENGRCMTEAERFVNASHPKDERKEVKDDA